MGISYPKKNREEENRDIPLLDVSGAMPGMPVAGDRIPVDAAVAAVETVAEPEGEKRVYSDEKMVLRTENLVKKYRQRTVVNHVSIAVTLSRHGSPQCAVGIS